MNDDRFHKPSQFKRDLLWVINSPKLVKSSAPDPCIPVLREEQVSENELAEFMTGFDSPSIGRYFEQLVLFWLTRIRRMDAVEHSVQIRSESGRVLGEIDFLFRDKDGDLNHWEIAVKFYLYLPDHEGESQFIGPNAKDNYEKKVKRLFGHQLSIGEEHYPQVSLRHAFAKGMIFYHPNEPAPGSLPERMPENHLRGYWIRVSELDLLSNFEISSGWVMQRPFWLGRYSAADREASTREEIAVFAKEHFSQSNLAMMICGTQQDQRVIIVPDEWPKG